MKNYKGWVGFVPGKWSNDEVNVRDFIQRNYAPYVGDSSFLQPATDATKELWQNVLGLYEYDVATGQTTKVPGMPSVGGAGFRSGGQGAAGKSWIMMDGELCLVTNNTSGGFPRIINLDTKEYWEWTWLTSDVGGGSNIISFTNGAEGSGEIIAGSWNAHYAVTYNIYEGKVTNITDTAGQTDSILWYKDILYGGCYSATVLVELDRERNEYTQRFKLDHEITGQKRLLAMAAGDDRVFVGSVPDSNLNGGSITVYNTLNGSWQTHRNVVQDHSITDVAYSNGVVFLGSTQSGGDGAASAKTSAMIVAYDYEKMQPIATLDPRDYFPGLASPVRYICNLTADPNTEENGRLWATVSDILFCFTFDQETATFNVQEVYSIQRTDYYDQSGWNRQQHQIQFIAEKNQLYVTMSPSFGGMRCITLEDWDAPIGSIKVVGNERIMNYCPEDFIIAQDNNMYFANGGDIMILPLNVTEEDWAIAGEVDEMILALDETVTLQSEAAIKTARSAYENLTWKYRALVQKLELLQEAESDILECKIAAWEGKEITADDYPAMEELLETYKGLNERQQRYVKNYKELKAMHNTASDLYDARCAAAVQEKVDALQELLPITSLEKEPAVVAVRTEFDALTGSQKLLVDTTILKEAEEQVAVLRAELVKEVEALIQAIPAEITLEAEPAIVAAREGVDKLYALERKQVSYSKLETAESKLRNLKNTIAKAEAVDLLIQAIGIVTLGDAERIAVARQAYNQLNEAARSFVKKLGKLQRAEFILAGLQTWMIPAFVVVGAGAAFCVVWFIPTLHNKVFKGKKKEEEPAEN